MDPARDPRSRSGAALKARRKLAPTRAGWVFFAFTLGVGFAALNTGNNLLYLVFALMLAFLVLSGVLSESALRGVDVTRQLPRELFAGAANPVRLEVHNAQKRLTSFAIVVEDRAVAARSADAGDAGQPVGRAFFLRVAPGQRATARYMLRPEERGTLSFTSLRVSTRFPFGLFVKSKRIDLPGTALVYPALLDSVALAERRAVDDDGESIEFERGEGADVVGLREYRSGDPLRRVHWKSSLRRRALVVLERADELDGEVEVVLDTRPAPDFERRVSAAASEIVHHLEGGTRVALRTEDAALSAAAGSRQRQRLLGFLARVEARRSAA